jgi:hypothetical protein
MGLSMDDINSGAVATGKLITESMNAWDRIQQSIGGKAATPPIAATPQAAVQSQPQTNTATAGTLNIGTLALLAVGAIVLLKVLKVLG